MTPSPHLKNASSAIAYFDRKRRQTRGAWVTVILTTADLVFVTEYRSQREAYEAVGFSGEGSEDPAYVPTDNGAKVAV